MGQSTPKYPQAPHFNALEWEPETEPSCRQLGSYSVLRNRINGTLLDKYHFELASNDDYRYYKDSLQWRQDQPNIVQVHHFDTFTRKEFCASTYSITVYLQHIKGRLSEFKDIPCPDNLYCMLAMLSGYRRLYERVGRFYLAEEQVCVDEEGTVRVWLNADLSKNYPQMLMDQQDGCLEESEMVEEIFSMIIANTDRAEEPEVRFNDFYKEYKKRQKKKGFGSDINFQDAKSLVKDYARSQKLKIPSVFQSMLEIYNKEEEENSRKMVSSRSEFVMKNFQTSLDNSHYEPLKMEKNNQSYSHGGSRKPPFPLSQPETKKNSINRNQQQNNVSLQNPPMKYQNLTLNEKNMPPIQTAPLSTLPSPVSMRCKTQPSQPHGVPQFRSNLNSCSIMNIQQPTFHQPPQYVARPQTITRVNMVQNQQNFQRNYQTEVRTQHSVSREPHSINMKKAHKRGQETQKKPVHPRVGQITQSQGLNRKTSQNSGTSSQIGSNSVRSDIYSAKGKKSGMSHRSPLQYYYTVDEQQELDPEIAADMNLYI